MALQAVTPYNSQLLNQSSGNKNDVTRKNVSGIRQNENAVFTASYSSRDLLSVNFSNQDGDTVSLTMEHVESVKTRLALDNEMSKEEQAQIIGRIRDEFLQFQGQMIQKILHGLHGKMSDLKEKGSTEAEPAEVASDEIPGLPEYWNAENTSQRIVDFATSFYGIAESTGKDYYDLMRSAIEDGFSQAMGIMGTLPDAVNNLANKTFDLALQKLDAWALEQGIDIGEKAAA
jgi:hypothetical protein